MTKGGRAPNGAGSFYRTSDGRWHGRITVGVRDDGKPDRRHVRGRTEQEVRKKARAIEKARDEGRLPKPGQGWTVEQWLTHWMENIAAPTVRPTTLTGYRFAINKHLVPAVGAHRLDRLEPEHLEKVYVRMLEAGRAPATAHQAHRTVRTALNEAVRRGHLLRNPAVLAKPPRLSEWEVEPLTLDEVRRVLEAAGEHRNRARWAVALALGLRQGEALGLRWTDVDLDTGRLTVRRSLQRPSWVHGCGGSCGRRAGSCPCWSDRGSGGIRTPGPLRGSRFQGECIRPLCHASTVDATRRRVAVTPTGDGARPAPDARRATR
jgi:integrase